MYVNEVWEQNERALSSICVETRSKRSKGERFVTDVKLMGVRMG